MNLTDHLVTFKIFNQFSQLVCGVSTVSYGNLYSKQKSHQNLLKFLDKLKINPNNLVMMDQIHGDKIHNVNDNHILEIKRTDGICTQKENIFLGVNTADCLPIFYFDPKTNTVAVVHAGWLGVMKNLPLKMIKTLVNADVKKDNLLIAIGPGIKKCCYIIDEKRYKLLNKKYLNPKILFTKNHKYYFDLFAAVLDDLNKYGINKSHIEINTDCTYCNKDKYYSFRRSHTKEESLGIIGIRKEYD